MSLKEQERAEDVLDDLMQFPDGMRVGELEFIEDMDKRRNLTWSPGQIARLNRIHRRVC